MQIKLCFCFVLHACGRNVDLYSKHLHSQFPYRKELPALRGQRWLAHIKTTSCSYNHFPGSGFSCQKSSSANDMLLYRVFGDKMLRNIELQNSSLVVFKKKELVTFEMSL